MKKSGASHGQSAAELISKRIAELGDWRGETLGRMRKLITEADPDVVEEWKWMNPVWAHDGIICTGESYKKAVKLIRPVSSTRASTETYAARSTSTKEKQSTRPPRSEEHTSELQSQSNLVCRLLLEKKKKNIARH